MFQEISEGDARAIISALSTIGKSRGRTLPRGTELNVRNQNTIVVVQSVIINAVPSGEFVGDDETPTIDGSVTGKIVYDVQTTKLN